jgi:small nuclear ribonucleoprotein (snRNP)-like protein
MAEETLIELLKKLVNKKIRVTTTTGETYVAILLHVDEEHRDVVHEILSTDRPERYEKMGTSVPGWYVTPFEYIAHVCEDDQDTSIR